MLAPCSYISFLFMMLLKSLRYSIHKHDFYFIVVYDVVEVIIKVFYP